jgi:hypothetical protein
MFRSYDNEDLKTIVEHQISSKGKNGAEKQNGSMAPDLDEMKRHGKDMSRMKTNHKLKQEGLVPDPVQFDEDE